jgi:hypothetical protein
MSDRPVALSHLKISASISWGAQCSSGPLMSDTVASSPHRYIISSVAKQEQHHLCGAVTRCGSDNGNKNSKELKNYTKCNSLQPIQFIF